MAKAKQISTLEYAEFVERLKAQRESLPPRLQDVAQFILNNPEDVAILTIVEIARAAGVPPSAVTRFTQELGLERFSDLQAVFRARLLGPRVSYAERMRIFEEPADGDGRVDLSDPQQVLSSFAASAYNSLLRVVEDQRGGHLAAFVEVLRAAPMIHISGARGAFGVASYCFYGLASVGKRAVLMDNLGAMRHQQLQTADTGDVVLSLSFDDYTSETLEIARAAADRGLTLLAITDNELSPLTPLARYALFVKEAGLGHFRSQVPAMVLCQSIIASVGRRSRDRRIGKS